MTVSSARKLRSVLCVLTSTAVILSFYSASATFSFRNLIHGAISKNSTAHPSVHQIYKGPPCTTVTPNGQNQPVVDLELFYWRTNIRTVCVYLPKGTSVDDITVAALSESRYQQPLTLTGPFQVADYSMDIYRWEGNIPVPFIRITGQSGQNMSLCLVKVFKKTLDEYCECSDPCHTNRDTVCTGVCASKSEDLCPRVNVALGKPAQMDSSWGQSSASSAVNGITGTTIRDPSDTSDRTQWNCAHTMYGGLSYWQVDLGDTYTINYLTVYRYGWDYGEKSKTEHWMKVSVDNQTCTTTRYSPEEKQDLFCTSGPLKGQVVRFSNEDEYIFLCEVQVWVCKPGHYGTRCDEECSEGCEQGQCDNSGTCDQGCKPGRYGRKCEYKCGHCQGSCDSYTGHCNACQPGYHGQHCKNRCSSDCAGSTPQCHQNGTCKERIVLPTSTVEVTTEKSIPPTIDNSSDSDDTQLAIVVGVAVGGVTTAIFIVVLIVVIKQKRNYPRQNRPADEDGSGQGNYSLVIDPGPVARLYQSLQPRPLPPRPSSTQQDEYVDATSGIQQSSSSGADYENTEGNLVQPTSGYYENTSAK